jgi:hypothetical protein
VDFCLGWVGSGVTARVWAVRGFPVCQQLRSAEQLAEDRGAQGSNRSPAATADPAHPASRPPTRVAAAGLRERRLGSARQKPRPAARGRAQGAGKAARSQAGSPETRPSPSRGAPPARPGPKLRPPRGAPGPARTLRCTPSGPGEGLLRAGTASPAPSGSARFRARRGRAGLSARGCGAGEAARRPEAKLLLPAREDEDAPAKLMFGERRRHSRATLP